MAYQIEEHHGSYNIQRRTQAVSYIVVHYVGAGTSAPGSALANCRYFAGGNRNASAHYFVDDSAICEYADPVSYATWHCGDGRGRYGITNSNSVGIEVCNNGGPYTEAETDRLAWLVQRLMDRFGVPADRVVRHYDASRKQCPLYYVQHPDEWDALHARITGGAPSGGSASAPSGQGAPKPAAASLEVDGWWGEATTRALQRRYGTPEDGVVSAQDAGWKSRLRACTSGWEFRSGGNLGSQLIAAMQRDWGLDADGIVGPAFINALIERAGYDREAVPALDGPSNSVRWLQRQLNAGTL